MNLVTELLAEMRAKSEKPPQNLSNFFSDPAKFEHLPVPEVTSSETGRPGLNAADRHVISPIFFDESEDRFPSGSEKSENFDIYDVSDVAPESKDASIREDESKALLKYQLRLAREEIENLKSSSKLPTVLEPARNERDDLNNEFIGKESYFVKKLLYLVCLK